MARAKKKAGNGAGAHLGFEEKPWQAADALRANMDAAQYEHVVLGLVFLEDVSDAFEEPHARLLAEKGSGADPEDLRRLSELTRVRSREMVRSTAVG